MEVCKLRSAFRGCLESLELYVRGKIRDPAVFLEQCEETLALTMADWVGKSGGGFKMQLCMKARLKKLNGDKITVISTPNNLWFYLVQTLIACWMTPGRKSSGRLTNFNKKALDGWCEE